MTSYFVHSFISIFILLSSIILNGCNSQGKSSPLAPPSDDVSIATENAAKTFQVTGYFNGFNAQMMRGPAWKASGFIEQVKELHPGLIRYPGGTVSSYWDWKTGWLKKDIPIRKEWKSIEKENPITLEDLKFACDQTGALPVFVLNLMTSSLEYQMEMLEHASKIGLPIRFVELDNEFYLGEEFYVKKFPTGKEYGEESNKWITAIKNKYPEAKIGVIGNSIREGAAKKEKAYAQRGQNWNRDVLSVIKNADAMTFHVYGGTGLNYMGPVVQDDDDQESADKAKAFQEVFDKKESIPYVLSIPFIRWNNSNTYDYKILPDQMRPWITEYNLFEREGVVAGTWAHGLYALMQTLLFMENKRTELLCYHNLTTTAQFAALFNSGDGFSKAVKKKPTPLFGLTAAGHCLSLSGKAMSEGGNAVKLNFSNNAMIQAARGQQYPSLYGWKIVNGNKCKIIVVNLSANNTKSDFSKVIPGLVNYIQINASPQSQIAFEQDVNKKNGSGAQLDLPAYSVTLLEEK